MMFSSRLPAELRHALHAEGAEAIGLHVVGFTRAAEPGRTVIVTWTPCDCETCTHATAEALLGAAFDVMRRNGIDPAPMIEHAQRSSLLASVPAHPGRPN